MLLLVCYSSNSKWNKNPTDWSFPFTEM